jgi:hypothetical protein
MFLSCSIAADVKTSAFTFRANVAKLIVRARKAVRRRTGRAEVLSAKTDAGFAWESSTK